MMDRNAYWMSIARENETRPGREAAATAAGARLLAESGGTHGLVWTASPGFAPRWYVIGVAATYFAVDAVMPDDDADLGAWAVRTAEEAVVARNAEIVDRDTGIRRRGVGDPGRGHARG
jgi:hypothetical protein